MQGRDRDSWTAVEQRDKQRAESFFFYTTKRDIGYFLRRGFFFYVKAEIVSFSIAFFLLKYRLLLLLLLLLMYLSISFYFGGCACFVSW